MANISKPYDFLVPARLDIVTVFEPRSFKDPATGKESAPKYEVRAVLDQDSDDFIALRAIVRELGDEGYEGEGTFWENNNQVRARTPFKSGNTEIKVRVGKAAKKAAASGQKFDPEQYADRLAYMRDKVLFTARSSADIPPALAGVVNNTMVDLTDDLLVAKHKSKFYEGVFAFVAVNLKWFEVGEQYGVTAYLSAVVSTGTGDRLKAGNAPASSRFSGRHLGHATSVNPIDDDEIPF